MSNKGASFVEIYQNCNVFNDGAFEIFREVVRKRTKPCYSWKLGKPLIFGENSDKEFVWMA
ncbi:MAG: hypothetical protein IPN88_14110 [Bacteroidetes bacterium]|nr:hypothetical protein [Bacteroidota bacterium]